MRGERRRLYWLCGTVAPWALASGLLVSFTASAGPVPTNGHSYSALKAGLFDDDLLVTGSVAAPSRIRLASLAPRATELGGGGLLGHDGDDPAILESHAPRTDMKRHAAGIAPPTPVHTAKGDPLVPLRPSLSRLETVGPQRELSRLVFDLDERAVTSVFLPGPTTEPLDEAALDLFERAAPLGDGTTGGARGDDTDTPAQEAAMTPAEPALGDGATPATGRALALSSTTPAGAEQAPLTIAVAPVSMPGLEPVRLTTALITPALMTPASPDGERPRYADLIDPEAMNREQRCLTQAVYFEARSEPEQGQAAVAQVILNRVRSGLYPASVCGVVFQNRHRHLACQFTFTCEGKPLRVTDQDSWRTAERIAREVVSGDIYLPDVGASTHYHADYVRPRWAKRLKKMDVIGRHIFYQLRPGQT